MMIESNLDTYSQVCKYLDSDIILLLCTTTMDIIFSNQDVTDVQTFSLNSG